MPWEAGHSFYSLTGGLRGHHISTLLIFTGNGGCCGLSLSSVLCYLPPSPAPPNLVTAHPWENGRGDHNP